MIERDIIASARMIDNILINYLTDMDSMNEEEMMRMYESVGKWTKKIIQLSKQLALEAIK